MSGTTPSTSDPAKSHRRTGSIFKDFFARKKATPSTGPSPAPPSTQNDERSKNSPKADKAKLKPTIHELVRKGVLQDVISALAADRANVLTSQLDSQGMTPMALAVLHGHLEIAKRLYAKGAKLDPDHNNGESLLCFAVINQRVNICRWLATTDPSVKNALDPAGHTPLHMAVLLPNLGLVRTLLEVGCDPNLQSRKGHGTPLSFAVDIKINPTAQIREGIVRLLLEKGAQHVPRACDGLYPIHEAASGSQNGVVSAFLEHGVDVNMPSAENPDENGRDDDMRNSTPLHYAAGQGEMSTVRLLLDKGANVHALNAMGETTLHWAATNKTPSADVIIRTLVGPLGVQINQRTKYGATALHGAAHRGLVATAETLLTLGADPTIVTTKHHYLKLLDISGTPGDIARSAGHHKTANHLAIAASNANPMRDGSGSAAGGPDQALLDDSQWLAKAIS